MIVMMILVRLANVLMRVGCPISHLLDMEDEKFKYKVDTL